MKAAQELMRELYYERDKARDFSITLLKVVKEMGELANAMIIKNKTKQEEELADVLAWLLSIANLLEIDAEKAFYEKYPMNCRKCQTKPCTCEPIENARR